MVSDHNLIDSLLHGPNSKLFIVGGAGVLVIMLYEYRKGKANTAAAKTVTTDTSGTDTTGGGYGDLSGYDSYGGSYAGPTLASYTDPATGAVITGSGVGAQILAPSTNGQWMQQAEAMLAQEGYDPQMVGAALGHLLHGSEMTPDEWTTAQVALGLLGQPPQGMPPPKVAPSSSTGGTPGAVPDGFYVQIPFNLHYQVQGGKRYALTPQTVAQLNKQHVRWVTTLISSPVYSLPRGNPYQI